MLSTAFGCALYYNKVADCKGLTFQGGRYEDAERIFEGMSERDGVKPDVRHFNLMIHTYGKAGKMKEAQSLLRRMKRLGLPLSAVSFNSVMSLQRSVADAEAVLRQVMLVT